MKLALKKTAMITPLVLLFSVTSAVAEYPEKPVEVIIPYGAGGNTDTSGRIFINAMRKVMNSDLVPLNVTGAGGTVGMAQLAKSDPNGYTIGFSPIAPVTVQPHLRPLPYGKDSLEPICMIADNPTSITVAPDSPYNSMDDLIADAKSGKKIVAVGGPPGSMPHITQAAVANAYGVKFVYLPAGGGGKAAKAILGGEATFAGDVSAMEKVHGLKTLAVSADERVAGLPDTPTFKELGKDVSVSIWFGAFAPKGTSDDVLNSLSAACEKAVQDADFLAGMEKANYIVSFKGRDEFKPFYESQFEANKDLLEVIGVKLSK